jgi:glycosyltransferase involved in cell wall biosynthesis
MKIYINREPKIGPWGGGIKTVNKLVDALKKRGYDVVFRLEDNIDVIFCIDPRPNAHGEWYQHFINYKQKNSTKIIQRVGDLGTHSKPELTSLVKQTLNYSNFFIFPSDWAKEYIGFEGKNHKVIYNCPMSVFHDAKIEDLTVSDKPKLVTHHWSMNPKKGFHLYEMLDEQDDFEFTYVGRKPDNINFKNHIEPISASELAIELPKHDIYITASIEEAGANHVLEGLACGLPVVYHEEGGSINDYCKNYGLSYYSFPEMISAIKKIVSQYKKYKQKVLTYEKTNDDVVEEYIKIIKGIKNVSS